MALQFTISTLLLYYTLSLLFQLPDYLGVSHLIILQMLNKKEEQRIIQSSPRKRKFVFGYVILQRIV